MFSMIVGSICGFTLTISWQWNLFASSSREQARNNWFELNPNIEMTDTAAGLEWERLSCFVVVLQCALFWHSAQQPSRSSGDSVQVILSSLSSLPFVSVGLVVLEGECRYWCARDYTSSFGTRSTGCCHDLRANFGIRFWFIDCRPSQ